VSRWWRAFVAWWRSTEYDVVCVPLERWHATHDEISKAEAREWALGVQVVALKERLRLAEAAIEAMRLFDHKKIDAALAAYDAVPGDS
jgi:hypothetical protein